MSQLTKEQEAEISWRWHEHPNLQVVYRTFQDYVNAVTPSYLREAGKRQN